MITQKSRPTIQQDLKFLYALDGKGIKPGLSRVLEFLDRIGNPHRKLSAIHVAGTNGKGTSCALLASILQSAGFKVGLYTSPHLISFNERIRINNMKISDAEIVDFLHKYRSLIDEIDTTFFETTTAMAFEYFQRNHVDVVILETGLGGRFDATNVITPLLSVITPIGKDHEEFLGHTLSEISREKAGIIKAGVPCVIAQQRAEVIPILREEAEFQQSDFHYAPDLCRINVFDQRIDGQIVSVETPGYQLNRVRFPLAGYHQRLNLQTVLSSVVMLPNFDLNPDSIRRGIENVKWHGRLELLSKEPLILYDVGHNLHGIRQVVATLRKICPGIKFNLLITLGHHKNIRSLGKVLGGVADKVYLSEIPDTKSVCVARLSAEFKKTVLPENIISNPDFQSFLPVVVQSLNCADRLLIIGSHYIAPAVYKYFQINI